MFSSRIPSDLAPNRLASSISAHRASGRPLIDLTATNPTAVGIHYDADLLAALSSPAALTYSPEPFGMRAARRAVATDYARRGISVAEDRIVLTASTSEAYSVLFKLLCAPEGDDVLVPQPSYPLFDHLTRLDGVSCRPYSLEYHGRWGVDERSVDAAWTSRTRALLAVSPNNPTGSSLSRAEQAALAHRCADHDAALILDEVFADYVFEEGEAPPITRASDDRALTFRLGGLSKSAGLPQVKLGWIAVGGPDALVSQALERLETICDAYLSVATPVQMAAPDLLRAGAAVRAAIHERVRGNYARLTAMASRNPACAVIPVEAGWYAVVQVPALATEEALVLDLLERAGVLVHPGYFYDFEREAFVVVSLLPQADVFASAAEILFEHMGGSR